MSGAPIMLPGRHIINLGTLAAIVGLVAYFTLDQSPWVFWTVTGLSFLIGFMLIIPIGGADMPVVVSMLNSYSGWAAAAMGCTPIGRTSCMDRVCKYMSVLVGAVNLYTNILQNKILSIL